MLTIACATNDGKHFTDNHFGEADKYMIYSVNDNGFEHIKSIDNTSIESRDHDGHGDALKAKHVMMLMKEADVQVVANKRFGPNINRIKIRFLPVIMNTDLIDKGLKQIAGSYNLIFDEYNRGNERKYMVVGN